MLREANLKYRQKAVERPRRKPNVISPIWDRKLEPKAAVTLAIEHGARSQQDIKRMTKLSDDDLTDALAELHGEDRLDRRSLRQRVYLLKVAA